MSRLPSTDRQCCSLVLVSAAGQNKSSSHFLTVKQLQQDEVYVLLRREAFPDHQDPVGPSSGVR